MAEVFRSLQLNQYHELFLKENKRSDGRSFNSFRETDMKTNVVDTADGSCIVKLGNTTVICGVKGSIVEKATLNDDEGLAEATLDDDNGLVEVTISLPVNFTRWNKDQLKDQEEVYAHKLNQLVQNSGCFDVNQLVINSTHSWSLLVEAVVLDFDGNVMDAAFTAILGSLMFASLPVVTSTDGPNETFVFSPNERKKLALKSFPFSSTFCIMTNSEGNHLILSDPTIEEETLSSGLLTAIIDNASGKVVSVIKEGGHGISEEEVIECCLKATERGKHLYQKLRNNCN